jgi:hypothetical protein
LHAFTDASEFRQYDKDGNGKKWRLQDQIAAGDYQWSGVLVRRILYARMFSGFRGRSAAIPRGRE